MSKTTLGQLFLMRRELKASIGELESSLGELYVYREDQQEPPITERFDFVFNQVMTLTAKLTNYDLLVNEANNMPDTVEFEGEVFSLAEARLVKLGLMSHLQRLQHHIRAGSMMAKREVTENIWDQTVTPAVLRPQKFKFKSLMNIPQMKEDARKTTKQIAELDSLIQKADWTVEVDIPE